MNSSELKEKMMQLWKTTFHDSSDYVSLVFDNYFNPDYIEYHEEGERVVSALLGIPYEFGNSQQKFRGLYLCGLATAEDYRNRGIMHSLIEKINKKAYDAGFSFTFLIPATEELINYYSIHGYEAAMYRVEDRYTDVHEFDKDYMSNLAGEDNRIKALKRNLFNNTSVDYLDVDNADTIEKIIDFIYKSEHNNSSYVMLQHSRKDLGIIISENIISKGKIVVSKNRENISGVGFFTLDERKRIHVSKVYYDNRSSLYKILDFIKRKNPDSAMSVYNFPEDCDRRALIGKVYGAQNPDGGSLSGAYGIAERIYDVSHHAKPYGMVRILNICEILKFLAADRTDSKFSILVKDWEMINSQPLECVVADGEAQCHLIKPEEVAKIRMKEGVSILKIREFMEILFRKRGSSNLIQEAFDIPRMPINMCLLLD